MIERPLGPFRRVVLDPVAARLVRLGLGPDTVSVLGVTGVVVTSLVLVPCGQLAAGAVLTGVFALADTLDGAMARAVGRPTRWGAFLDSTLDRIGDAAVLSALAVHYHLVGDTRGLALALACVALAPVVPYSRARGEALGASTPDGLAARADRMVAVLAAMLAVGLGAPGWVLHVTLALLLAAVLVTIAQRMAAVRRHLGAVQGSPSAPDGAGAGALER